MIHRSRWWTVALLLAAALCGEWLRQPAVGLAYASCAAVGLTLWGLVSAGTRSRVGLAATWIAGLCLAGLGLTLLVAQHRLDAIERNWPRLREVQVSEASQLLGGELRSGLDTAAGHVLPPGLREAQVREASRLRGGELRSALHTADGLALRAAEVSGSDRTSAFKALAALIPAGGPEIGLAVLESTGIPWAWAGRHRLRPVPEGDSIAARASGYYVILETRRHSAEGRIAVASVLLWAHPAVPEGERSLSELFRARTGVGLAVYPPGSAPRSPDLFDYEEPTTAGPRLLFSVQPVPPAQGAAKEAALRWGRAVTAWLLVVSLLAGLIALGRTPEQWAFLLMGLWLAVRTPVGAGLGLGSLFSPATFFRPFLGSLSSSAGVLALTGGIAALAGIALWHRGAPRRSWSVALGAGLLVVAPYLISELGKGITPPANGVPIGLWLTWQLTLVVTSSALIIIAAAVFRGDGAPEPGTWRIWAGVAVAFGAAVVGLVVWNPRYGWPDWYTFLWTPALFLVTVRAPRWATVIGIALVAGSSAALVTWGAELNGRLQVARRDLSRLGPVQEPLAVPLLERFSEQLNGAPAPTSASELYALWRTSVLGDQEYPARLGLWGRSGAPLADLSLDSLDLPTPLVSTLVRNLDSSAVRDVVQVYRIPGIYYVLLQRVRRDLVLTAAIGPRTRLIVPDRLARLLRPPLPGAPLYDLSISPPEPGAPTEGSSLNWRREGWSLRAERRIGFEGGLRHVHALIDMRGPAPLLVRGGLVVLLDAALLALLWYLAELGSGRPRRRILWRRGARSFQVRLAVTLAGFFVLPAAGFAAWSFSRVAADAQRGRDLLITQALRDAVLTAGGLLQGPSNLLEGGLRDLGSRLDADLALYSGGAVIASSAPILLDLGLVEPLLDPDAFQRLALGDELEATRDGEIYGSFVRVGFRVVRAGPPGGIGVLATPQLADDSVLVENQLDLAMILLLATLLGLGAALAGAQAAARALSRPVADLRRSALALGQGQPPPGDGRSSPPIEFEAVFGAFERMARDIRSSQHALEEARHRTAAVLATVATGVVALDLSGRVLLANPRAHELLGRPLEEGVLFDGALDGAWAPLADAVRDFLDASTSADTGVEFEVAGRRFRLQLARLASEPGGVVLALDDLTDVTQAERVLAWGDMARQVAHEIKNPLTPIRLGVQHLRRAFRDRGGGADFERTLDETSGRILAEIDRLDTIARAFSRFAAPGDRLTPLEQIDLLAVASEVLHLYALGDGGAEVRLDGKGRVIVWARPDEVKEVLGNLLENARHAGAASITVRIQRGRLVVQDDGQGIPSELLPRIFEPRFSTTTSGSGLGLAIVRRLVQGWGARIQVQSEMGKGTVVEIRWD